MPKFPRFIPLSESAEEDSSSGSDEDSDDGSVTSRRTSDPFDEDFPDAQDQFTEDGLDNFALFDQAEEQLFAKNPLPPLAGRSLATSTFGSSSNTEIFIQEETQEQRQSSTPPKQVQPASRLSTKPSSFIFSTYTKHVC